MADRAFQLPETRLVNEERTMEDYFPDEHTEDLSHSDLDTFPGFLTERATDIMSLKLDHNNITVLPRIISSFVNLVSLDISNNGMSYISPEITNLGALRCLSARNNNFEDGSIPKDLGLMQSLQMINLSGNQLTEFPMQLTQMTNLTSIFIGANRISSLPPEIRNIRSLEVMYAGGNNLVEIPDEVGLLTELRSLVVCDNKLVSLPRTLVNLRKLECLSLHNNQLSTLPPEIVKLNLVELSLRNNPLVVRFVQDMVYEPPSLLELAGRVVKTKNIQYSQEDLPMNLVRYLDASQQCVNPKCKGVFFSSRVEHIKFVDFCGKYRLPLLQYLCSPGCTTHPVVCSSSDDSESEEELPVVSRKMKRVLLG